MSILCRPWRNVISPIGNDIIDRHAEHLPPHPRFAERVLCHTEYEKYRYCVDADLFMAKAWAAKEAAFKYFKSQHATLIFRHREFVFDDDTATVTYAGLRLQLDFIINDRIVYAATASDSKQAMHNIALVDDILATNAEPRYRDFFTEEELTTIHSPSSLAVRVAAKRLIASHTGIGIDTINFAKNRCGAPVAFCKSEPLAIALSFSHHGGYVAAMCIIHH